MNPYEETYIIFNNILSGCRTMIDSFYFAEKFIQINSSYKDLLIGMIHNKKYDKILDMRTLAHTLNELKKVVYREEVDEFIDKNTKNNIDTIQLNTFLKMGRNKIVKSHLSKDKSYKITHLSIFKKKDDIINSNLITKHCPHCNIITKVPNDSEYVICGYSNNNKGYDWDGCGKDWCPKCDKLLCKSWDKDKLFVNFNRIHNSTCCKEYAEKNLLDYNNFCHCTTLYVKRDMN
jgi:hypothetical protein